MPRCPFVVLLAVLLAFRGVPAWAQGESPSRRLVVIRDAETETLLHKFADPLFRAASLSPGLVRIVLVRDPAINAFVSSGNRMFIHTGPIQPSGSSLEASDSRLAERPLMPFSRAREQAADESGIRYLDWPDHSGEADLALAEEAMLEDGIPAARRFARQAAKALPRGPVRLRALDISNAVKKENRS